MRPLGVHVQVAEDPGAARKRVAVAAGIAPAAGERAVEAVQLGGDGGEAVLLGPAARLLALARSGGGVLGEPRDRGADELGLLLAVGRRGRGGARGVGLQREPRTAFEGRNEDRGLGEQPRALGRAPREPRMDAAGRAAAGRTAARRTAACGARRAPSRAARRASGSHCGRAGARGRATRARSAAASGPRGRASCRRRARERGSRRETALRPPPRPPARRRRARRFARAAALAAPCPADTRGARARRSSRPRSCARA